MIVLVAVAFALFVRRQLIDEARRQADRGVAGSMEGHAAMDMSITATGRSGRACSAGTATPRSAISSSWSGLLSCATW